MKAKLILVPFDQNQILDKDFTTTEAIDLILSSTNPQVIQITTTDPLHDNFNINIRNGEAFHISGGISIRMTQTALAHILEERTTWILWTDLTNRHFAGVLNFSNKP